MDPGVVRDAFIVVLGLITGALSGAFGVGGAVVSTPGIRALGVPALLAIGTTLPSIFPSALSGSLRYRREGLIDGRAVMTTVPSGLVFAVVGALLAPEVPGDGHVLMIATAALLAFTAWRMARRPVSGPAEAGAVVDSNPEATRAHPERRSVWGFVGVGSVAGLLSGLLGIGGGVVMVPGFHALAGLSLKASIATSLVCVAAFALPGTLTHALLGNIDWRVAALLTIAVVPGARLGAAATMRTSDRRLRLAVAGFLGVIALVYAVGEVIALAR